MLPHGLMFALIQQGITFFSCKQFNKAKTLILSGRIFSVVSMKQVIRKEDKAVSPIIATILLVAITVVLAATLYTILGNYTLFLGSSTPSASITVQNDSSTTTNYPYYIIYVNQFSGNVSLQNVQMRVTSASNSVYLVPLQNNGTYSYDGLWNISISGASYLSATTSISMQGNSHATSSPYLKEIQLIDLKTNGVIATYNLQP